MMNYEKNIMKFGKKLKIISKKQLDSKPVCNEKNLKAKIKSYNRKINTTFHNNNIPKEGFQFVCLSVILTNCVFKTSKNYYVFLEECKNVVKETKMPKYIIGDIEISSDSDRKKILLKKILMKKILVKKTLMKKTLMKKILMKKIKYRT